MAQGRGNWRRMDSWKKKQDSIWKKAGESLKSTVKVMKSIALVINLRKSQSSSEMTTTGYGSGLEVIGSPREAQGHKDKKYFWHRSTQLDSLGLLGLNWTHLNLGDLPGILQMRTLPFTACVILGKSLNFHAFLFSCLHIKSLCRRWRFVLSTLHAQGDQH